MTPPKHMYKLGDAHIAKIVDTCRERPEAGIERHARRVPMQEIIDNDYNLNIPRKVSTAEPEQEIDPAVVHADLLKLERSWPRPRPGTMHSWWSWACHRCRSRTPPSNLQSDDDHTLPL